MSYLQYLVPAAITGLLALYAFFKDAKASKSSVLNWAFVAAVGLLWPITLPFILWKRLLLLFSQDDIEATFSSSHLVS